MGERRQPQAWGGHRGPFSRRPRLLLEARRTMKALKQPEHGRGAKGDRQARGSHANGDFDVTARSRAGALFLSHHISFTFLMQE